MVKIVDLTAGTVVDLTGERLPNATSPTWSPTGDRLAFVKRRAMGSGAAENAGPFGAGVLTNSEILVFTFATGEIRRIGATIPDPWRIGWSPTGDHLLAYSRADGMSYSRGSIYLLDIGTDAVSPIDTTTLDLSPPVWSPDGTRFAFVERGVAVRIVSRDGDDRRLIAPEHLSRFLAWAPSGDAIVVAADGTTANSQILVLDGARVRWLPVAIRYDPDGMHAGPPQWGALNPVAAPTAPTHAGTAADPGKP
jgi:Tol biopolymer transport system component